MKLPETFWRGFWWKLGAALALIVISYAMPSRAKAQDNYANCVPSYQYAANCPTRQIAYEQAQAAAQHICNNIASCTSVQYGGAVAPGSGALGGYYFRAHHNTGASNGPIRRYVLDCPSGQPWDEQTKTCKAPNNCAAKPPMQNILATRTSTSGAACIQGCFYAPGASTSGGLFQFNLQARSGLQFVHEAATNWNPTGASCEQPDENKPYDPSKDTCVQQGTLTQCVKPDGKFCVTATTGRRICWAPGETGQKTTQDGSLAGDRQKAPAAPSVTGIEGGESNTGQHAVNNTTYNQDIKTGGTQSGSGQSNTGDGGADDTDGDGKNEDQGSASGGGTCAAPPTCSGDPINCAILQQQWQTRCQNDKNDDGQPDWTEGEAPETPGGEGNGYEEGDVKRFGIPMGPSQLDDTDIFGGGSCPNFSITIIGFEASTADIPAWCDIAAIMRGIILIMGAYTALQILQGRFL